VVLISITQKLADIITKNNGTIILGKQIEKIIIKDNNSTGIIIDGNKKELRYNHIKYFSTGFI